MLVFVFILRSFKRRARKEDLSSQIEEKKNKKQIIIHLPIIKHLSVNLRIYILGLKPPAAKIRPLVHAILPLRSIHCFISVYAK